MRAQSEAQPVINSSVVISPRLDFRVRDLLGVQPVQARSDIKLGKIESPAPSSSSCVAPVTNPCSIQNLRKYGFVASIRDGRIVNLSPAAHLALLTAGVGKFDPFTGSDPSVALVNLGGIQTTLRVGQSVSRPAKAVSSAFGTGVMRQSAVATTDTVAGPVTTGYSPGFGNPGTVITITGSGFGTTPASSMVSARSATTGLSTLWPVTSSTESEITVTVPSTMTLGKVYLIVAVNGVQSHETNPFTVGIPPEIVTYEPQSGVPQTPIILNGTGFGKTISDNTVLALSTVTNTWSAWPVTSVGDGQIMGTVPANAPPGKVLLVVVVDGLQSIDVRPFTVGVPSEIATTSPPSGAPGTVIKITGTGFGNLQGNSVVKALSDVTNATTFWPVQTWSDTLITVSVPAGTSPGRVFLTVIVGGLESIGENPFTVGIPPVFNSCYDPKFGPPGTLITIQGSGFGTAPQVSALSAVTNASAIWPITTSTDSTITVMVPPDFPLGKVFLRVFVNGLESIGANPFTVGIPPIVNDSTPLFGLPGSTVTIHGSGFGAVQGNSFMSVISSVTNGTTQWPVVHWDGDTQITVKVPDDMPIGRVFLTVTVGGLQSIDSKPFTVGIPPAITSYTPESGSIGTVLTITGTGFGKTQGDGSVTFLSATNITTVLKIVGWSDTEIRASVPKYTPAGRNFVIVTADGLQSLGAFVFNVQY
jgi:hypothetical protein